MDEKCLPSSISDPVLCSKCKRIMDMRIKPNLHLSHQHSWKFRNIATSLLHSTITGLATPVNLFYLSPQILTDMINWSSEVLLLTLAFSVGYFIYDAVDMYVNNPKTSTYQLLGHHFCVIVCFAIRYV